MNTEKKLHIVCHDVPYPANYGGVVDLLYKIKSLHEAGVEITLHAFAYGREKQEEELKKYCKQVFFYNRTIGWKGFSFSIPYIVQSRKNNELLNNLLKDNEPVLLEGVHCTGFLKQLLAAKKKVILRLHNVESNYYRQLFKCEKNIFKKCYFFYESILLRKYEKKIPDDLQIIAVSRTDAEYYQSNFHKTNISKLSVFIPYQEITSTVGMGNFCLYHGNLEVAENEKAAAWLLQKVFCKIKVPLVIAGKNPSKSLDKLAHLCQHTCMVTNPSDKEMSDLIAKAHINILPSFNNTGIKLKLLHALFKGKHCLVNDKTVEGTGLEDACHIGNTADAMASIILQLHHLPFAEEELSLRKKMLQERFNNKKNAEKLIQMIW